MVILDIAMKHVRKSGADMWVPCFDDEEILGTGGSSLVFLHVTAHPENTEASASDRASISEETWQAIIAAAETEFRWRLPPPDKQRVLSTFLISTDREPCAEDRYWPVKRVMKGLVAYTKPRYEDTDHNEVIQLVAELGRVYVRKPENWTLAGCSLGGATNEDNAAEELLDAECRCVHDEESGDWYVVHDPKWARALRKRRTTQAARTSKGGRTTSYLLVDEFYKPIHAMSTLIRNHFNLVDWNCLAGPSRPDRDRARRNMTLAVVNFNKLFGKNAHRQVPEWQAFMKLWRKHGEATASSWGRSAHCRSDDYLFDWLDEETKVRKPPAASLEWRIDRNVVGIPGGISEDAYMRNYSPKKYAALEEQRLRQAAEAAEALKKAEEANNDIEADVA